jgi:hypothetical protein
VLPDRPESNDAPSGQILHFRKRWRAGVRRGPVTVPAHDETEPIDDLAEYEKADREIDYRRRMLTNVIAVAIVAMLVAAGLWIADTIENMQKVQDCAMQGRQNCAPIELPAKPNRP